MVESHKKESALLQIFIGVAIIVIGGVILNMIGINPSGEQSAGKKAFDSEEPTIYQSTSPYSKDEHDSNNSQSSYQSVSSLKNSEPKVEDYSVYINVPSNRSNVSVAIEDASGNLSISASSEIANIYKKTGKTVSTGLIKSTFIKKPEFQELRQGNSELIKNLKLNSYTDYLAIGRISFNTYPGKLVDETIICNASISMSIISTRDISIEQSFTISNAAGNGATESQAQENAFQKLLSKYINEHSSL